MYERAIGGAAHIVMQRAISALGGANLKSKDCLDYINYKYLKNDKIKIINTKPAIFEKSLLSNI